MNRLARAAQAVSRTASRQYARRSLATQASSPQKGASWGAVAGAAGVAAGLTYFLTKPSSKATNPTSADVGPGIQKVLDGASLDTDFSHKPKYGGPEEFKKAYSAFVQAVGEESVSTDEDDIQFHGYSSVSSSNIDTLPFAVLYPHSTEEVSEIAKICHTHKLPMIGYSGGTSLEGHLSAMHGGICIDFANMNKIIAIRPGDMDATVQPAVGWVDLNNEIKKQGHELFLAVDPGPTAEVGGMVANSCSGTNCVKYGPMRDHVVNLTVVLADGTILKTRQRPRKTSAGYSLNHLFSGSEGTLGLITEITVKLQPIPNVTSVAVQQFPTVHAACQTAVEILKQGIPMAALELMDDQNMIWVNNSGYAKRQWEEKPALFMKFAGASEATVAEQVKVAKECAAKHTDSPLYFGRDQEEQDELWSARKNALYLALAAEKEGMKAWTTDVAVPLSQLPDIVMQAKQSITEAGLLGGVLGHIGDGNYHAIMLYYPEQKEIVADIVHKMVDQGLAAEGTCTGEHGIGFGKIEGLLNEIGPVSMNLMRTIKLALDPHELLNPGKIFNDEAIVSGLKKKDIKDPASKP